MKKLSLLVLLASISCGGGNENAPAPSTPAPAASSAAPEASASVAPATSAAPAASSSAAPADGGDDFTGVAWKDMTKKQRGKYMGKVVMPKMKEMFQAFDGKTFEKFNCGTCHGAGAADGSFKMPNPGIFVLPATKEEFEKLGKTKGEWMKFMGTQVKPEMAKLLGEKEMDPKNPQAGGFGCMACHTMKQGK